MQHPNKLRKGDTIGIVSPSAPVAAFCPNRLKRGVEELKNRGFQVKLGKHVSGRHRHMAGTIEQRVEDIHAMFADDEIKAIICTIGGQNANQMLEALNFQLIKQHPKIFVGYSDITALLNAIATKSGLVTFLGPAILPQFGEYGGMFPYTWNYFEKALIQTANIPIEASEQWTDEFTPWDKDDNRPRTMQRNSGMMALKHGRATGTLVGGNLGTWLLLVGTPYMPDLEGTILCIEEDEVETPATIDRKFFHLRHCGALSKIKGILIGRFHSRVGFNREDSLEDIVRDATTGCSFPILYDLDFGHTDPMLTIPIGGQCEINTADMRVVFAPAVKS